MFVCAHCSCFKVHSVLGVALCIALVEKWDSLYVLTGLGLWCLCSVLLLYLSFLTSVVDDHVQWAACCVGERGRGWSLCIIR